MVYTAQVCQNNCKHCVRLCSLSPFASHIPSLFFSIILTVATISTLMGNVSSVSTISTHANQIFVIVFVLCHFNYNQSNHYSIKDYKQISLNYGHEYCRAFVV